VRIADLLALFVFVDEAGDLGFNDGSSKTIVVAYAIVNSPERVRIDLNRLRKKIHQRHKMDISEFKFSSDSEFVRSKVLAEIVQQDLSIGYFVADKNAVKNGLRKDPTRLYNYVVVNYVITNMVQAYDLKEAHFIIDKSMPRRSMEQFNQYLSEKISWRQVRELGKEMPKVEVSHEDSRNDKCIQLADYCAGSAFNYFERRNKIHFSQIEPKVKFRNSWGNVNW
jgi:hypothetical protein